MNNIISIGRASPFSAKLSPPRLTLSLFFTIMCSHILFPNWMSFCFHRATIWIFKTTTIKSRTVSRSLKLFFHIFLILFTYSRRFLHLLPFTYLFVARTDTSMPLLHTIRMAHNITSMYDRKSSLQRQCHLLQLTLWLYAPRLISSSNAFDIKLFVSDTSSKLLTTLTQ